MKFLSGFFPFLFLVIPNPPKAVILQNIGEKSMNVTWKLPKGWPENDKGFLTFRVLYWQQWLPDGRIDFPPVCNTCKNVENIVD